MMKILLVFNVLIIYNGIFGFISVQNKKFVYNNQNIFLSGVNIAWDHYARDFGSGAYSGVKSDYQTWISSISNTGGNVIRVWVHIDGQLSPNFDSDGYATGTDTQSLINDLGKLLDYAKQNNIFVILCLWNLAVRPQQTVYNLYWDDSKLNRYIVNVLKPLVNGLKNKTALAAWDVINEPMGSVMAYITDPNPCFDTNILANSGSNWAYSWLSFKQVLKFINLHADAIKSVDPKALVTVGDSEIVGSNICQNCRNYYSDQCLITAGGKPNGVLDFYQFHAYTYQGSYANTSPMKHKNSDYNSDKPIIVGEFSTSCSDSFNSVTNYEYIYNNEYSGGLDWQYNEGGTCSDTQSVANAGMNAIRNMASNGKINITV